MARGIKRRPRYLPSTPTNEHGWSPGMVWYSETPKAALFDIAWSLAWRLIGEENREDALRIVQEEAVWLGWRKARSVPPKPVPSHTSHKERG